MKIYVCLVCGHLEFDNLPLKCPVCHAPQEKFKEDNQAINPASNEGKEKHVPQITVQQTCGIIPDLCKDVLIKIGSTLHPMVEDHWIQWIDIYLNKKYIARYELTPQLQPALGIHLKSEATGTLTVIESCNKHGKWMAETKINS